MLTTRVVIVDDQPSWREILREMVNDIISDGCCTTQHDVHTCGSLTEANDLLDRQYFHVALVDLRLDEDAQEHGGMHLVKKIAQAGEGTSTIIVSGYADSTVAIEAFTKWNAFHFLEKDRFGGEEPAQFEMVLKAGVSKARDFYRASYSSAIDFLRDDQEMLPWTADVLDVILGSTRNSELRDIDHLCELLDVLLRDLFPLLRARSRRVPFLDRRLGLVSDVLWSKGLGRPIEVILGGHMAVTGAEEALRPHMWHLHTKGDFSGAVVSLESLSFDLFRQA